MNKYHKSILNTLGYDIVETKGEKVTGIKHIDDNRLLDMNFNVFIDDNIKIHLRDRNLAGPGLSLDDEEEKKAIREKYVMNSESDIIDIGLKGMGQYYFHCFCRQSTGSYSIVLENHNRRGFYGPLTCRRKRIFAVYTNGPHSDFDTPPLTITMNKIDKLYVIINGDRGENICIYPMETEFIFSSSKTNSICRVPYENFDEVINSSFIEQISNSPISGILMKAFKEIMPTVKLFIADNIAAFKALQERQEQLAIVQRELLEFDKKYAAFKYANKINKEESRQELESQLAVTQLELLRLDERIADFNKFKKSQTNTERENEDSHINRH